MTPAEHILAIGKCKYCETPIEDNDRCGCPDEVIYYLTIAVELLSDALQPLADAWEYLDYAKGDLTHQYIWKINSNKKDIPGISLADTKNAHDVLEQVELML